jgi:hypothetical protein
MRRGRRDSIQLPVFRMIAREFDRCSIATAAVSATPRRGAWFRPTKPLANPAPGGRVRPCRCCALSCCSPWPRWPKFGGAWLVWQGVREHGGLVFVGAGIVALGAYGFAATFQPDPHFGRILAAYGGCSWLAP